MKGYGHSDIQSTLSLVDSVLSGHLSQVDKSSGPGRTCLYFNIILSVLSGPLSYVDNGQIFVKFGQDSLSYVHKNLGNIMAVRKYYGRQEVH